MKSTTYFGQGTNPFQLDTNQTFAKTQDNLAKTTNENPQDVQNQNPNYITVLPTQYRKEILALKNYIQKINIEIRKNLKLKVLPSLEESFSSFAKKINSKEISDSNEIPKEVLNEWLNNLLNIDYINPLFTLYENYIANLEEELKFHKNKSKEYESIINKIISENNELRKEIKTRDIEMKDFLEIKNDTDDTSSMLVLDRDYLMKIEEKNRNLSKENEILVINLNRAQNELFELKNKSNDSFLDKKNVEYEKLNLAYRQKINDYKMLQEQFEAYRQKFIEFSDKNAALENENQEIKEKNNNLVHEIKTYKETIQRYEDIIKQ